MVIIHLLKGNRSSRGPSIRFDDPIFFAAWLLVVRGRMPLPRRPSRASRSWCLGLKWDDSHWLNHHTNQLVPHVMLQVTICTNQLPAMCHPSMSLWRRPYLLSGAGNLGSARLWWGCLDHHADTVSNVVQPPSGHQTWHAGNPFDDFPMEFSESHGFFTGGCLGEWSPQMGNQKGINGLIISG